MTRDEIVAVVADRLNLTSAHAISRIGFNVQERFRAVMSGIGLQPCVRTMVAANTVIGNSHITFTCAKVFNLFNPAYQPPAGKLVECTVSDLQNDIPGSDPPTTYAVYNMGATTVTILLGCTPTTIYPLNADAELNTAVLAGSDTPGFNENFHDILIYGAMATELDKKEKYDKAQKQEAKYELRLADLRFFIAKSQTLAMQQNNQRRGTRRALRV